MVTESVHALRQLIFELASNKSLCFVRLLCDFIEHIADEDGAGSQGVGSEAGSM